MLTCLFWNINGVANGGTKPLAPIDRRYQDLSKMLMAEVNSSSNDTSLDILILAESPFNNQLALPGMRFANTLLNPNAKTKCALEIYYRESTVSLAALRTIGRATVQSVTHLPSGKTLLLVAAHLESPQRPRRGEDRKEAVRQLAALTADAEKEQNTCGLLVGNLNYDPFELPVYGANYLHAVPTKILARDTKRTVHGTDRLYFYNPMWAHFGDVNNKPAGTYYKRTSDLDCRFWHMPDQLLLRPALLRYWQDDYLTILTSIGGQDITKHDGTPDVAIASDHLPLLFRLNL